MGRVHAASQPTIRKGKGACAASLRREWAHGADTPSILKVVREHERRVCDQKNRDKSVLNLLNLVDTITFDSKEEAEASQHRPLRMRLEYFQEMIEEGLVKKVMKSETIGINTDPVTITTGQPVSKEVRPASALHRGGNGGGGTTTPQLDRLVPRYIHENMKPANKNIEGVVLSLKKGGHVTWS